MELIKLRDKDINEFKKLMQESFQYGYETVYGSDKEQVLPDKAIGTVRKQVFSVGDKYEIEIFEEKYELMMLAIAVAMAIEDNSTDFGRSY